MEGRGKKLVQLVLLDKESHDECEVRDIEPTLSIAPRSPSILKSHDGDLIKHSITNVVESSNIRDDKTQPIRVSDDGNSSGHAFSGTEEEQYVPKPSSSSNISINAVESSSIHNDQTLPIRVSYSENSSEQDFSGTDDDEQYVPNPSTNSHSSSSSSSSSSNSSESSSSSESDHETLTTGNINQESGPSTMKRSRKRTRNQSKWKKNVAKMLKNSGQQYTSLKTGMVKAAKIMGPTCSDKCRLSCSSKFSTEKRTKLFDAYWQLGQLQRQRDYLASCVRLLELSYRRIKESRKNNPRKPNTTFYLYNDEREVRVCKTFFMNTLGATERILRTVIECKYKDEGHNIMKEDGRGRHGKQIRLDEEIKQSVYAPIADLMSLKRYQQIRRFLHFADKSLEDTDRYYKVRPIAEKIRKNCLLQELARNF
ncbi:uncharacterized protein LOC120635014 [Pararge aegeria]|uniref:uncharacterized protein LOC120635014 n=1 Tax=Pararge aegeria TaxID=116150 RepID=UPI0019CF82B0|nr:uncharacterized protein LOC120635014 [Pararge aegeria]